MSTRSQHNEVANRNSQRMVPPTLTDIIRRPPDESNVTIVQ